MILKIIVIMIDGCLFPNVKLLIVISKKKLIVCVVLSIAEIFFELKCFILLSLE